MSHKPVPPKHVQNKARLRKSILTPKPISNFLLPYFSGIAVIPNLLLTSYCATFMILLLCVKAPHNNGLLLVTSPLTAGHKSMFITAVKTGFGIIFQTTTTRSWTL